VTVWLQITSFCNCAPAFCCNWHSCVYAHCWLYSVKQWLIHLMALVLLLLTLHSCGYNRLRGQSLT